MKRRKNPFTDEELQFILDGTAESEGLEGADITPALRKEADRFEEKVEEVIEKTKPKSPHDVYDVMDSDAAYNAYQTLAGAGVGIWDGRWDKFYTEEQIKDITKKLERKAGSFVDSTGGGSLEDALRDAVHETGQQENPKRRRRKGKCAVRSGKLSSAKEGRLRSKTFGLPKQRKYPMPDASHARNAKARASGEYKKGNLTRKQYAMIQRKANRIIKGCGGDPAPVKNPKGKTMKKNPEHETRGLELFIDNDAELYHQRTVPIQKNLVKKKLAGKFDINKAPKLFGYLVEAGAKKYAQDFGGTWNKIFSVQDRKSVAQAMAREFDEAYRVGDYDHLIEEVAPVAYKRAGYTGAQIRSMAPLSKKTPKKNPKKNPRREVRIRSGDVRYKIILEETGVSGGRQVGGVSFYKQNKGGDYRHIGSAVWNGTNFKIGGKDVPARIKELAAHWMYRAQQENKTLIEVSLDKGGQVKRVLQDYVEKNPEKRPRYEIRRSPIGGFEVWDRQAERPVTVRFETEKRATEALLKLLEKKKKNPKKKVIMKIPNPGGKMTKKQFEAYFKTEVLPIIIAQYGPTDKPARREGWNNVVDAMMKAKLLPARAGDWAHPKWLETYKPRRSNPKRKKVKRKVKKKVKRKVRRKAPARRVTKTTSSKSVTVTKNPSRAISAWMRL